MRIVFMGTPDFAVPCLERLLDDGHRVAAAISQPDKPKGRGYALAPTPVKLCAEARGVAVHQPAKLRDGAAEELLRHLAPDLAVVVAYGRILPPALLRIPRLGCVNVHASLLPRLRGAAPIQWSVITGDRVTGVTTMFMAEGLDTGDILLQRKTPIGPEETAGELFERLSALGADCLSETVRLLEAGEILAVPQNEALSTYAPMLDKKIACIDFAKTAGEISCLVRGTNPAPCARAFFGGKMLKVHKAAPATGFSGKPGQLLSADRLIVGCAGGAVELQRVQPEGKRQMDGAAWLMGRRARPGEMFTLR